jgi:hypothetical protein
MLDALALADRAAELADQGLPRDGEVVEDHLAAGHGVPAHLRDRRDLDVRGIEVDDEQRQPVDGAGRLTQGRCTGQDQCGR